MVESGKTTLSSQFVQLPDTPTNFIVLASPEAPNSPNHWPPPPTPPKRVRPVRLRQSRIKDIYLFYPPSFIPIPPLQEFSKISPSSSPQCQEIWVGIWNKSSETWIPSKYQISLISDRLFVRYKYPNFHVFQEFRFPPTTPPNVTESGRNLKLKAQDPSRYQISLRSGHPFVS